MSACADQTAHVREMKGGDGVLRLSLSGEPRSLNPNVAPLDQYALLLGQNIFSKLVALADNGGVLPDVAERWEQSGDGRTYTFYIRRGIRFHDGQPLTAEDARRSRGSTSRRMPNWDITSRACALRTHRPS
jgi:ABC-type transport system substrate-binding protein